MKIFTLCFLLAASAWGQGTGLVTGLSSADLEIRARARLKQYPGGSDQDQLKVQQNLKEPKVNSEKEDETPSFEETD